MSATANASNAGTIAIFRRLLPTVWFYRWRVLLGLSLLVGTEQATIGVPLLLKHHIDTLDQNHTPLTVPALLL
ncbi:metal ABC transporter permease, partial [Lysobacter sp. 2RAB21]